MNEAEYVLDKLQNKIHALLLKEKSLDKADYDILREVCRNEIISTGILTQADELLVYYVLRYCDLLSPYEKKHKIFYYEKHLKNRILYCVDKGYEYQEELDYLQQRIQPLSFRYFCDKLIRKINEKNEQ